MDDFRSAVWTIFVRQFGRFLFGSLDNQSITTPISNPAQTLQRPSVQCFTRQAAPSALKIFRKRDRRNCHFIHRSHFPFILRTEHPAMQGMRHTRYSNSILHQTQMKSNCTFYNSEITKSGEGRAPARPPRRFLSHAEARNRPLRVGATHGEATKPSEARAERARRCRLQAKRGQPGRSTGFKSPGVLFEVAGRTSLCHSVWMVRSYSWLRYTVTISISLKQHCQRGVTP